MIPLSKSHDAFIAQPGPGRLPLYFLLDIAQSHTSSLPQALARIDLILDECRRICRDFNESHSTLERVCFTVIVYTGSAFQAFPLTPLSEASKMLAHANLHQFTSYHPSQLGAAWTLLSKSMAEDLQNLGRGGDAKPLVYVFTDTLSAPPPPSDDLLHSLKDVDHLFIMHSTLTCDSSFAGHVKQLCPGKHSFVSPPQWHSVDHEVLPAALNLHLREHNSASSIWTNHFLTEQYCPSAPTQSSSPFDVPFLALQPTYGLVYVVDIPVQGVNRLKLNLPPLGTDELIVVDFRNARLTLKIPEHYLPHTYLRGEILAYKEGSDQPVGFLPLIGWVHPPINKPSDNQPGPIPHKYKWTWVAVPISVLLLVLILWCLWYWMQLVIVIKPLYPSQAEVGYHPSQPVLDPLWVEIQWQRTWQPGTTLKFHLRYQVKYFKDRADSAPATTYLIDKYDTLVPDARVQKHRIDYLEKDAVIEKGWFEVTGQIDITCSDNNVFVSPATLTVNRRILPLPVTP